MARARPASRAHASWCARTHLVAFAHVPSHVRASCGAGTCLASRAPQGVVRGGDAGDFAASTAGTSRGGRRKRAQVPPRVAASAASEGVRRAARGSATGRPRGLPRDAVCAAGLRRRARRGTAATGESWDRRAGRRPPSAGCTAMHGRATSSCPAIAPCPCRPGGALRDHRGVDAPTGSVPGRGRTRAGAKTGVVRSSGGLFRPVDGRAAPPRPHAPGRDVTAPAGSVLAGTQRAAKLRCAARA